MKVFRISAAKYAGKLNSSGSANRWNKEGQYVIYTGSSRSLSSLELVVHRSSIRPSISYKVMIINIADEENQIKEIKLAHLPKSWKRVESYAQLQALGSEWYSSQSALILKVPSVIIPHEHNYVINCNHPAFKANVKLDSIEDYFWDLRLL